MVLTSASSWYVSPTGTGDGSLGNPWGLQSALTNASVSAGDTVFCRSGVYVPPNTNSSSWNMLCWLVSRSGSAGNPITLKPYQSEVAQIDRPWRFGTSDYWTFYGLQFYDSLKGTDPHNTNYPDPRPLSHFDDANTQGHFQWLNCVIHDVNNVWSGMAAGELIRSCIIWHAGNTPLDHVAYDTPDTFSGNIIGWAICDALNLCPRPFTASSNIIFSTGVTSTNVSAYGDMRLNTNSTVAFNYIYGKRTNDIPCTSLNLSGGDYTVSSNKIVAWGAPISFAGASVTATSLGNVLHMGQTFADYATIARGTASGSWTFDLNVYSAAPPSRSVRFEDPGPTSRTFAQWQGIGFDANSTSANAANPADSAHVIPSQDVAKRAHVAVFNFTGADNVSVSMSGVLDSGDYYTVYSAQNYLYGPISSGIYNGSSVTLPMTNLTAAALLYSNPDFNLMNPPVTSPTFAAFILQGATITNGVSVSSSLLRGVKL